MKTLLLAGVMMLLWLAPNALAYDKDTKACMMVCMARSNPYNCAKERSVPRCRKCIANYSAMVKSCMIKECRLDADEAAYESKLNPDTVCGK